jgi:hypothetical protein
VIWRLTALVLGALVYVLVLLAAIAGSHSALEVLVTATVVIFLVGAGNLFQNWIGIKRRPPRFARPDLASDPAAQGEASRGSRDPDAEE